MPPGSLHGLVLRSDDLAGDHEELTAKGVQFDGPPQRRPWGTEETVLRDPDRNGIVPSADVKPEGAGSASR